MTDETMDAIAAEIDASEFMRDYAEYVADHGHTPEEEKADCRVCIATRGALAIIRARAEKREPRRRFYTKTLGPRH